MTQQHGSANPNANSTPRGDGIFIIGSGLAGYTLAREIRKLDKAVPITIVTRESGHAYSKPMLSTGFTKAMDADALAQTTPESMAEMLGITIWTNTTVTGIDTASQTLSIDSEHPPQHYGKLVLALGADVIKPPIGGNASDQVTSVNSLEDYRRFRECIETAAAKRIVIIGGGLIGCEFTNDLINGGFGVDTIDPMPTCLPTLLPEVAGKAVQAQLEQQGARFHFGQSVTEVNNRDGALSVTLSNGQILACDVVLSAVGVRPSTRLAQDAGLQVSRGIVTDRYLQTSAANVYAMGDCAEVAGHVLVYVTPIMVQSKALAKTLTGDITQVNYPAMPVTIKTPACPVCVAPPPKESQGQWRINQEGSNVTALFECAESGALLGFAVTGERLKQKIELQKQLPAIMT